MRGVQPQLLVLKAMQVRYHLQHDHHRCPTLQQSSCLFIADPVDPPGAVEIVASNPRATPKPHCPRQKPPVAYTLQLAAADRMGLVNGAKAQ